MVLTQAAANQAARPSSAVSPQVFNQPTSAAGPSPEESVQLSGGGMSISTKNAIVSAVAGLGISALALSGVMPGGHIGTWLGGMAVFALTKGIYHGVEEIRANKANGSPYSDGSCFKLGFSEYGKRNILNGLLHSTINTACAGFGPMGVLAGAGISGGLTKLTGY